MSNIGPPNWWLRDKMIELTDKTLNVIDNAEKRLNTRIDNISNNTSGGTGGTGGTGVTAPLFIGNVIGNTAQFSDSVSASTFIGNLSGTTANLSDSVTASLFIGDLSGTNANLSDSVTAPLFIGDLSGTTANLSANVTAPLFIGDLSGTNANLSDSVTAPLFIGNVIGNTAQFSDSVEAQFFLGDLTGNVNGNNGTFTNSISTAVVNVTDRLNIDNTNYFNIGAYISKHYKVINTSTMQNIGGFSIADLQLDQNKVEQIFNTSKFFTLSHPPNQGNGRWTTGIDLNLLSAGHGTGIMQDYQNYKFAVSYKVETDTVHSWNNSYSLNTFPTNHTQSWTFGGEKPETIYIQPFKSWSINFYFIGRWRRAIDNDGNVVAQDINEFDIAIFNELTTNGNYETGIVYVLDMTVTKSSPYASITI
jgi:hypothetical protein